MPIANPLGTGTFNIQERTTGSSSIVPFGTKELVCGTNGTYVLYADLEDYVDNGYISIVRTNGGTDTLHEDTVDALTSESWFAYSNRQIILSCVAGDKISGIKIFNQELI